MRLYTLLALTEIIDFSAFTSVLNCYDFNDLGSERAAIQRQGDVDDGSFVEVGYRRYGTIVVENGGSGYVGSRTM